MSARQIKVYRPKVTKNKYYFLQEKLNLLPLVFSKKDIISANEAPFFSFLVQKINLGQFSSCIEQYCSYFQVCVCVENQREGGRMSRKYVTFNRFRKCNTWRRLLVTMAKEIREERQAKSASIEWMMWRKAMHGVNLEDYWNQAIKLDFDTFFV